MDNVAARFHQALVSAGIPIIGVSIGDPSDRSTWRIVYTDAVTADAVSSGEALRLSFDPNAPEVVDAEKDTICNTEMTRALVKAMLIYHERERFLDKNGVYPTAAELTTILSAQRPKLLAILKTQL